MKDRQFGVNEPDHFASSLAQRRYFCRSIRLRRRVYATPNTDLDPNESKTRREQSNAVGIENQLVPRPSMPFQWSVVREPLHSHPMLAKTLDTPLS